MVKKKVSAIENFWKNFQGFEEIFFRVYILQKFSAKAGLRKNFFVCIRSKKFKGSKKETACTARKLYTCLFFVAENFSASVDLKNFTQQLR